jgi:serine/threonine protein kinase
MCGTCHYMAPEQVDSSGHSFEVDIWAIGVTLYKLLVGAEPFVASSYKEIFELISKNQVEFPDDLDISEAAKDLVLKILRSNPSKCLFVFPNGRTKSFLY